MPVHPELDDADFGSWVKRVWHVVGGIPRGHVLTYGDVSRLAGPGGSARRVSQAMRRAPRKLALPWHRVINAQGRISLPADSPAYHEQKRLLEMESVQFTGDRIDLDRFGYAGALDQLLWGQPPADS